MLDNLPTRQPIRFLWRRNSVNCLVTAQVQFDSVGKTTPHLANLMFDVLIQYIFVNPACSSPGSSPWSILGITILTTRLSFQRVLSINCFSWRIFWSFFHKYELVPPRNGRSFISRFFSMATLSFISLLPNWFVMSPTSVRIMDSMTIHEHTCGVKWRVVNHHCCTRRFGDGEREGTTVLLMRFYKRCAPIWVRTLYSGRYIYEIFG